MKKMLVLCAAILFWGYPSFSGAGETPKTYKDPYTGMEFVYIEGGEYLMGYDGQPEDIKKTLESNNPWIPHTVRVSGFYIGKYEVTQQEWTKVMGNNPSEFKNGDRYPVESVSWNDTQEFIKKLNAKTGKHYRLPTEAEWEYAAKGGVDKAPEWGNNQDEICRHENVGDRSMRKKYSYGTDVKCDDGYVETAPVGSFLPNGYGLYDMLGNVAEWCNDLYSDTYYLESPEDNPKGPSQALVLDDLETGKPTPYIAGNGLHCIRGGGWGVQYYPALIMVRSKMGNESKLGGTGFRLMFPPE